MPTLQKKVCQAWLRAVLNANFAVAVVYATFVIGISNAVSQHTRRTPLIDENIRSPLLGNKYKSSSEQIVPGSLLIAICTVVPLLSQVLLSLLQCDQSAIPLRLYGFVYACSTTDASINMIKRYCGYWRPYFYDECDFDITVGKCEKNIPGDAFRSFPSGHAALSFVSLGYTTLCLLGAARCGTPRMLFTVDIANLLIILCMLPAFLAAWIASTRVRENDHWPADIVTGATIGSLFASVFYFRAFPSIFDFNAHLPRRALLNCSNNNNEEAPVVSSAFDARQMSPRSPSSSARHCGSSASDTALNEIEQKVLC